MSELLLQKLPQEFGVHFRREGVLHQVQKLTDPDNPICVNQFSESPLASWSATTSLQLASGRSWTVAGSSLANMFPEQLRVPKRRENLDNSAPELTETTASSSPQQVNYFCIMKRTILGRILNFAVLEI
jgi:hypothetical protein